MKLTVDLTKEQVLSVLRRAALATGAAEDGRESQRRQDLRARCSALGWSQNEWARRAGVDPAYASRVLAGRHPGTKVLVALERALAREERKRGLA